MKCNVYNFITLHSRVDDYVKTVIDQHYQTMPHRNNKEPFKHWLFDFPEICQMVIVTIKKLNSETRKYDDVEVNGRIVSKFVDDIDCGTMYRVSITNDISTERKKFIDISAEKDYYVCRFKYLQNNPNEKSALDISHDKRKKAADLKEKRLRMKVVKNNVAFVPLVNEINHNSAVAIMRNDDDGNSLKKRALSWVNNFIATLSVIEDVELTPTANNSSSSSSFSASSSSSLPLQISVIHPTVMKRRVNDKTKARKTIPTITDIVTPRIGSVGILNLLTSNDYAMSSSVTADVSLLQPHGEVSVHKVYARSGRQIRSSRQEEAICECGCNKNYDRNTIVYCKGGTRIEKNTGCKKMLNMKCCPQWMCNDCQWATNNGN